MRDRSRAQKKKNSFNLFAAVKYLPRVWLYDVDFFAIAFLLFPASFASRRLDCFRLHHFPVLACLPARRSVLPDTIVRIVSFAFWKNQCSHSHPVTFTYKSALICSIQHSLWWDFDFCTLVCDDFFCSVSFALLTLYHSTLSNGKCWIISYLHREYLHVSTPYNASATHSKFSLIPTQ